MESLIRYIMSLRSLIEAEKMVITSYFREDTFAEGDYLFRGGRVCNKLFFIVAGTATPAT